MIYVLMLIDILAYNYTRYNTYFFLVGLYNKNYLYYLSFGLVMDFIVMDVFLINTLIITVIYYINNFFKKFNLNNFWVYLVNLGVDYILYIGLTNIVHFDLSKILIMIGNGLLINGLFYLLSYKKKSISYN